MGPPSRELTEAICRVPSTSFSQAPWYTLPVHLCRFRVRSHVEAISWNAFAASPNPIRTDNTRHSSHSTRPGTINPVPIAYAFRPRLRGRLTLRGLALRRNPWTFGESVSHTLCRYSCQHAHFRYLHPSSQKSFTGLRNAPLPISRQLSVVSRQKDAVIDGGSGLAAFGRCRGRPSATRQRQPRR